MSPREPDAGVPPEVERAAAALDRAADRLARLLLSTDRATVLAATAALVPLGPVAVAAAGRVAARARGGAERARALYFIVALARTYPREASRALMIGRAGARGEAARSDYDRAIVATHFLAALRPAALGTEDGADPVGPRR